MPSAAAQEDLNDLVNEQQGDCDCEADQPLFPAQRGQAQDTLHYAELGRQDGHQQRRTIKEHLISIMQNVPVEGGGGFIASAEAHDDAEERKGNKAHGSRRGRTGRLVGRLQINRGDRRQDPDEGDAHPL